MVLKYRSTMWSCLTGRVSHHALKLILAQLELAKSFVKDHATPIPSCIGAFSSTVGPPCLYRMAALVKEEGVINQTELDVQWWLKKPYLTSLGDMASKHSDFKSILTTLEEFSDSLNPLNQQILTTWYSAAEGPSEMSASLA